MVQVLRVLVPLVASMVAAAAAAQEVKWWQGNLEGALEASKDVKSGTAMLYFWREEDSDCRLMFQDTIGDKACQQAMQNYVCMGIKEQADGSKPLFEKYAVHRVPTVLIVRPDGMVVDVLQGVIAIKPFLAELERIAAGKDTIAAMRDEVAKKPNDLALQLRLAKKLRASGDTKGADAVQEAILQKDPKCASEPAAEAMLLRIVEQVMPAGIEPAKIELKPLKEFLIKQKNKRILFLGWDRIAAAELLRDDLKEAADAAEKAWKYCPPDMVLDWGQKVASKAYGYHEELTRPQLKVALQISEKALEAAEAVAKERGDAFLANALHLHAAVQIVNNLRKDAFASMERAIQLNPRDENLKKALDRWKDGSK